MSDAVDWSDPCAALAALRPQYYAVLGGSRRRVKFDDREVEYHPGNAPELARVIARLEEECSARTGQGRRRFAMQLG